MTVGRYILSKQDRLPNQATYRRVIDRRYNWASLHPDLGAPETPGLVRIDQPDRLHERITNRRPDKLEPPFAQIPAQSVRRRRPRLDRADPYRLPPRLPSDKPPKVRVKTAKFPLRRQERLGVDDRRSHLEPIADNPRIRHQPCDHRRRVPRHLRRVKSIERPPIALPLLEDRLPTEPRLRPFEDQELEQHLILMLRHAPFLIVVNDVQLRGCPAATTRKISGRHNI